MILKVASVGADSFEVTEHSLNGLVWCCVKPDNLTKNLCMSLEVERLVEVFNDRAIKPEVLVN